MPVAIRLVEVLALMALLATMAAGAALVIFLEKCLHFLLMITDPLVYVLRLTLGVLKYVFLTLIYKVTTLMQHASSSLWSSGSKNS